MKSNNNISLEKILEKYYGESSKKEIKNIEKQLILFNLREKEKNYDININDSQIIKGKEQIIFSIISNNILEKIDYFLDPNENFNFELFIFFLFENARRRIF